MSLSWFTNFVNGFSNLFSKLFLSSSSFNYPGKEIIISLSIIVIIAAFLSFISKLLKQDLMLAYLLSGIILGPFFLNLIKDVNIINNFAEIGVAFLIFTAGLELNLKKFKESFNVSIIAGIAQVVFVSLVSFLALLAFSFTKAESFWLGLAIAFSSTVVVTKLLADKNELNTIHGRFIIGIMLTQDFLAILVLALLTKNFTIFFLLTAFLKLLFLLFCTFLLYILLIPATRKASQSTELLFIISLACLFLLVFLCIVLNLSISIGAFLAGITLANSKYKFEIETRTKALRDFFSVLFFVSIGMLLSNIYLSFIFPLITLILILVILEPFVTAVILRMKGYTPKTALDIGLAFAQLSEFSLIVALTAINQGIITQKAFDLIVLTAIISIALTPYTMRLSNYLKPLNFLLSKIKARPLNEDKPFITSGKKQTLLIGCHRMGSIFLKKLEEEKEKLFIIDFNPEIIKALEKKGISCLYGDASNLNLFDKVPLKEIEVVISLLPSQKDNLSLLYHFRKILPEIIFITSAQKIDDALDLYRAGADYVIMPFVSSAEHSVELIKNLSKQEFKRLKQKQINHLNELHRLLY